MYSFVKFVFNLFRHSESSTIQHWSTHFKWKNHSRCSLSYAQQHRSLAPTLAFLAKRYATVKNWKAINTSRAHGASQLHWSREGVPHSVHPNEIRRRNPPANTATNRKCTCWHALYALAVWHVQRTPSTNNQTCTSDEWYTATSPTNEHGRNSQAHHRGGVTQGSIASCGISVVRSGISCHVAGERPSRPAPLPVSGTIMSLSTASDDAHRVCHGRFRWLLRSSGRTWSMVPLEALDGTRGTGGRWVVPRLCGAGLVPSDGSAVAAAKHSSATRRWVVRNLTWLAISKMLFDDEIALKWGVAYYYK